ncbi:unnamed protein product, partial [Iphiclides podalirius]
MLLSDGEKSREDSHAYQQVHNRYAEAAEYKGLHSGRRTRRQYTAFACDRPRLGQSSPQAFSSRTELCAT